MLAALLVKGRLQVRLGNPATGTFGDSVQLAEEGDVDSPPAVAAANGQLYLIYIDEGMEGLAVGRLLLVTVLHSTDGQSWTSKAIPRITVMHPPNVARAAISRDRLFTAFTVDGHRKILGVSVPLS